MATAPGTLLRHLFDAAVTRASPGACLARHLPPKPKGSVIVVGAGKAAASMAAAVEQAWDGPLDGLVVTRYGHLVPTRWIEVVEAAHPVPDAAGRDAAARILRRVSGLGPDDLVLALISGGASALLALPAAGVSLEEKQAINRALLVSGATIAEMNCVRKHLSAIKGGRLAAAAAPARIVTLAISDVPGDDPAIIGSGPTVADPTTHGDALAIIRDYGIPIPPAIRERLSGTADETPKPGAACFERAVTTLIVTPRDALEAAAEIARAAGYEPVMLGDALEGEARELARSQAALARAAAARPDQRPSVLLSGGETTVTVRGKGRGGRNVEFLLALAIALEGTPGVHAIAGDTDGIDGTEDNAGAVVTPDTLARAAAIGLDARSHLAANDGYGFFEKLGDLVFTGPTMTNVNDFRAILIGPAEG
jgi:hydroxypyruvate reductase